MLMDFYRAHPKPSRLTLAAREQWVSVSSVRRRTAVNRHPTAADLITLITSEIRAVSVKQHSRVNVYSTNNAICINVKAGYSPHPTYGMVVQPDYANTYPGYGPNAYQCSGPYGSSLGPGGALYPVSSVQSPYSPTTTSCYAMPPPQHLPSHDKLLSKDGWVSLSFFSAPLLVELRRNKNKKIKLFILRKGHFLGSNIYTWLICT